MANEIFTDNFTGTNGATLLAHTSDSGHTYSAATGNTAGGTGAIFNNRVRDNGSFFAQHLYIISGTLATGELEFEFDHVVGTTAPAALAHIGVVMHSNSLFNNSKNHVYMGYYNGGYILQTQIGATNTERQRFNVTLAANMSHHCLARAFKSLSTGLWTYDFLVDGTSIGTWTDSASEIVTDPGIAGVAGGAGSPALTDAGAHYIDNLQIRPYRPTAPTLNSVGDYSDTVPYVGHAAWLQWTKSTDADVHHYRVEYSTTSTGPWSADPNGLLGDVNQEIVAQQEGASFADNTQYFFRVFAQDDAGIDSAPSSVVSLTFSGPKAVNAAVLLSGKGNTTTAGRPGTPSAVTLSGKGNLSATFKPAAFGSGLLSGKGNTTVTTLAGSSSAVSISGRGNTTVTGVPGTPNTVRISGNGGTAVVGQPGTPSAVGISGSTHTTAAGTKADGTVAQVSGRGNTVVSSGKSGKSTRPPVRGDFAASSAGVGATGTVAKPTNLVDGDLLVAFIATNGNVVVTGPTGFSRVGAQSAGSTRIECWIKPVTDAASEGVGYGFTWSTSAWAIVMTRVSGVNLKSPVDDWDTTNGAASTTASNSGTTTTSVDDILLSAVAASSGTATFTSTDFTEFQDFGANRAFAVGEKAPVLGAQGTLSWTISSSLTYAMAVLALKPVSVLASANGNPTATGSSAVTAVNKNAAVTLSGNGNTLATRSKGAAGFGVISGSTHTTASGLKPGAAVVSLSGRGSTSSVGTKKISNVASISGGGSQVLAVSAVKPRQANISGGGILAVSGTKAGSTPGASVPAVPTRRDFTTRQAVASTGVLNVPALTQPNDFMIATFALNGNNVTIIPSGWTQLVNVTATNPRLVSYWKIASGSEPASYTWTFGAAVSHSGILAVYSGVDLTAPIDTSVTGVDTGLATSITATGLSTAAAGELILAAAAQNSSTGTFTTTAAVTEVFDSGASKSLVFAEAIEADPGAVPDITWTWSGGRAAAAYTAAIKPGITVSGGPRLSGSGNTTVRSGNAVENSVKLSGNGNLAVITASYTLSDVYAFARDLPGCIHAYAMQETGGTVISDGKGTQDGVRNTATTPGADGPMGGTAILNKTGVVQSAVGPAFTVANNATDAALADTFTFIFAVRRLTTHPGRGDVFLHKGANSFNVAFVNDALRLHKNGGSAHFLSNETFKDVHKWHLVVIRKTGTTTSLRVDGVELTKASGTDQTFVANTTQISVGGEAGAVGEVSMAMTNIYNTYVPLASIQTLESMWTGKASGKYLRTRFGVHGERQAQGSSTDRIAINAKSAALHAKIVRSKANIGAIAAGVTEPGVGDFARHDAAYQEVEAAGMENLAILYGSPQWMNGSATDGAVVPGAGSASDPAFLTWLDEQAQWTDTVVRRYMPGGAAGTKVRLWEAWNEPNLALSWKSAPSATQYAAYWARMRTVFAAIDPNFNRSSGVLKLAMATLGSVRTASAPDIAGIVFLDSLVSAGAGFEILSLHPYDGGDPAINSGESTGKANDMGDAQLVRDYLQWKNRSNVRLWLTEFGFTVAALTEAQQSSYLLTELQAIRDYWQNFTDIAIIYADADWEGTFGLHVGTSGTFTERQAAQTAGQFMGGWSPNESVGISERGHLSISRGIVASSSVSLSGNGTLSAAVRPGSSSAVGISGRGAPSVTAAKGKSAAVVLSGGGTTTVTGRAGVVVAVLVSGKGTPTAVSFKGHNQDTTLPGQGHLTVQASAQSQKQVSTSVALSGRGTTTVSSSKNSASSQYLHAKPGVLTGASGSWFILDNGPILPLPFSIRARATIDPSATQHQVLVSGYGGTTALRWGLIARRNATGNFFSFWSNATSWVESTFSPTLGVEYIFEARLTRSSITFVVNGVVDSVQPLSSVSSITAAPIYGYGGDQWTTFERFTGDLADVELWTDGASKISGNGNTLVSSSAGASSGVALSGKGNTSATGQAGTPFAPRLSGNGNLSASAGPKARVQTVSLSGNGTLSTAQSRITGGPVLVSTQGHLTSVALKTVSSVVRVSGSGSPATQTRKGGASTAAITGRGTLASSASAGSQASVVLSGTGFATASGREGHLSSASLSANGAPTAAGQKGRVATATLSERGHLVAAGVNAASHTISLAGTGHTLAVGRKAASASIGLSGGGDFGTQPSGSITVSGSGHLTLKSGKSANLAHLTVTGAGSLQAVRSKGGRGSGTVSGTGRSLSTGEKLILRAVQLSGSGHTLTTPMEVASVFTVLTGNGVIRASGRKNDGSAIVLHGGGDIRVVIPPPPDSLLVLVGELYGYQQNTGELTACTLLESELTC